MLDAFILIDHGDCGDDAWERIDGGNKKGAMREFVKKGEDAAGIIFRRDFSFSSDTSSFPSLLPSNTFSTSGAVE